MSECIVRRLNGADAADLKDCFVRCYGDTYPADVFYDVDALRNRIDRGQLKSVIAVADGVVAGHTGLTVRYADSRAVEAGNTVVDPAFRGQGLLRKLGVALHQLCEELSYVGYLHYPTTAHEIMQKAAVSGTGRETGIMLGYVPSETTYEDVESVPTGRLATTVVYQPISEAPSRDIIVPDRYADLIEGFASELSLVRHLSSETASDTVQQTYVQDVLDKRRSLRHVAITVVGNDFPDLMDQIVKDPGADIVHVDFALDDPRVDEAVDLLFGRGFKFCAWLPEFRHTDVLRMQFIHDPKPETFEPALATQRAKAILDVITS